MCQPGCEKDRDATSFSEDKAAKAAGHTALFRSSVLSPNPGPFGSGLPAPASSWSLASRTGGWMLRARMEDREMREERPSLLPSLSSLSL